MKPWLWIPPQVAHDISPFALQALAAFRDAEPYHWRPLNWRGLNFANPLGIAGGVDKDGESIEAWWAFGAGFLEIGTVTPRPQSANDGKIIDRDISSGALWNRMGFPGKGAYEARENLHDLPTPRPTPVFVNIGKNRQTPNERAIEDYVECIDILARDADAFVINISSPNTTGLRDLFKKEVLRPFLNKIALAARASEKPEVPLLLKLSPDLSNGEIATIVETAAQEGITGFVATNTTLAREHGSPFPAEGGASGSPLAKRSKEVLALISESLGAARPSFLIVSAGGVMTPEDVFARLDAGANLVQVYTALVFEGPWFFSQVARAARSGS